MRVWNVPPEYLDDKRLVDEHCAVHGIWGAIKKNSPVQKHPQAIRFVDNLGALWRRHEALVADMARRGFRHYTPFPIEAVPEDQRNKPLHVSEDLIERDISILRERWEKEGNPFIVMIGAIPRNSFNI